MDLAARTDMMLAASFAGMGFGNAGVHIPHACAYPIAGMVRAWRPAGYPQADPLVPHGFSVALTAPAAFRFTFPANPDRHLRAARILDPHASSSTRPDEALSAAITALMRDIEAPQGLATVGYGPSDIDALVEGAIRQQRLLAIAPRTPEPEDLAWIFEHSMENY